MKKIYVIMFALFSFCRAWDQRDKNPTLIPLSDKCISCIGEAISDGDKSWKCEGDVCGMFRITKGYWIDAGRPTISSGDDPLADCAYPNCTNNEECATRTVRNYLTNYAKDCDQNGIIDCDDYAVMHKYGGFEGCKNNPLPTSPTPGSYGYVLHKCMNC